MIASWCKPLLLAVSLGGLLVTVLSIAGAGPAAAQQSCNAPLGWWESKNLDPFFLNPNGPSPTTACDFQLWSWSAFVHWMQRDPKTGLPMFLLLPTFNDLKPDQGALTALQAASLVHQRPLKLLPRNAQPQSLGSFEQAGPGGVLVDQAGRAVYYTTHMDPIYFAFTQKYFGPKNYQNASPTLNYPIGATVFKSSWRIVRPGEDTSKLYTTTAIVPKLVNAGNGKLKTSDQTETVTVALIGVHVVGVIKDHPEFVWATFELPATAPDLPAGMDPHSPNPVSALDFPLYKAGTAADQCNYLPDKMSIDEATQAITPITNVFQEFPDGGATPPSTAAAIASSNSNFQSAIPAHKDKLDAVFANFRLTGSTWLLANTLKPGDGQMDTEAIGSIDLVNATMETFVQGPGTNCFTCHRTSGGSNYPGKNINTSHIITSQLHLPAAVLQAR
jgi:hypothetical protein